MKKIGALIISTGNEHLLFVIFLATWYVIRSEIPAPSLHVVSNLNLKGKNSLVS